MPPHPGELAYIKDTRPMTSAVKIKFPFLVNRLVREAPKGGVGVKLVTEL